MRSTSLQFSKVKELIAYFVEALNDIIGFTSGTIPIFNRRVCHQNMILVEGEMLVNTRFQRHCWKSFWRKRPFEGCSSNHWRHHHQLLPRRYLSMVFYHLGWCQKMSVARGVQEGGGGMVQKLTYSNGVTICWFVIMFVVLIFIGFCPIWLSNYLKCSQFE